MHRYDAGQVAMYSLLVPPFGMSAAALFLGERITTADAGGGACSSWAAWPTAASRAVRAALVTVGRRKETGMHGIHVPVVTPFTADGAVDVASLERLAHQVLDEGAAGLVALGTTGEAQLLTAAERRTVVGVCRRVSDAHRTPLTVGAGTVGTAESAEQAAECAEAADLLLVPVPYYLRPSDEGVLDHFAAVGAAAGVPLVVYNVPYRSGKTLRVETLLTLLARDDVAGVKHCAGAVDADTLDPAGARPRRPRRRRRVPVPGPAARRGGRRGRDRERRARRGDGHGRAPYARETPRAPGACTRRCCR